LDGGTRRPERDRLVAMSDAWIVARAANQEDVS
jgi:hypothetical protein